MPLLVFAALLVFFNPFVAFPAILLAMIGIGLANSTASALSGWCIVGGVIMFILA